MPSPFRGRWNRQVALCVCVLVSGPLHSSSSLSPPSTHTQAAKLINGLSGERIRWTEDSANFADTKRRLAGDCAVACAFISYCGPFNQEFRKYLINDKFITDCKAQNVPVTTDLDVVSLLVDVGTMGDWNLQVCESAKQCFV